MVISDWDGYREAITDGEEGILVPSTSPPPGLVLIRHTGI